MTSTPWKQVRAPCTPTREALGELSPRPRQGPDASSPCGCRAYGLRIRTGPQGSLEEKSLPSPGVSPQWGVGRAGEVAGSGRSSHRLPPVLALGLLEAASCLACPRGWGGSSSLSSRSLAPYLPGKVLGTPAHLRGPAAHPAPWRPRSTSSTNPCAPTLSQGYLLGHGHLVKVDGQAAFAQHDRHIAARPRPGGLGQAARECRGLAPWMTQLLAAPKPSQVCGR